MEQLHHESRKGTRILPALRVALTTTLSAALVVTGASLTTTPQAWGENLAYTHDGTDTLNTNETPANSRTTPETLDTETPEETDTLGSQWTHNSTNPTPGQPTPETTINESNTSDTTGADSAHETHIDPNHTPETNENPTEENDTPQSVPADETQSSPADQEQSEPEDPQSAESTPDESSGFTGFFSRFFRSATTTPTQCHADKNDIYTDIPKVEGATFSGFNSSNAPYVYGWNATRNPVADVFYRIKPGTENDEQPTVQVRYSSKNPQTGNLPLRHTRWYGMQIPDFLEDPQAVIFATRYLANREKLQSSSEMPSNFISHTEAFSQKISEILRSNDSSRVFHSLTSFGNMKRVRGTSVRNDWSSHLLYAFKLNGSREVVAPDGANFSRNINTKAKLNWSTSEMKGANKLIKYANVADFSKQQGRWLSVYHPSEWSKDFAIYYEAKIKRDVMRNPNNYKKNVGAFVSNNDDAVDSDRARYFWNVPMSLEIYLHKRRPVQVHGYWDVPHVDFDNRVLSQGKTQWVPKGLQVRMGLILREEELAADGSNLIRERIYREQGNNCVEQTHVQNTGWIDISADQDDALRANMGDHPGVRYYVHTDLNARPDSKTKGQHQAAGRNYFEVQWRGIRGPNVYRPVYEIYEDQELTHLVNWHLPSATDNHLRVGYMRVQDGGRTYPFKVRYYADRTAYAAKVSHPDDFVMRIRPYFYRSVESLNRDCPTCVSNPIAQNNYDGVTQWLKLGHNLKNKNRSFTQDVIPGYYRIYCEGLKHNFARSSASDAGQGDEILVDVGAGTYYGDAAPFIVGDDPEHFNPLHIRYSEGQAQMRCIGQRKKASKAGHFIGYHAGNKPADWENEPLRGFVMLDAETTDDSHERLAFGLRQGRLEGGKFIPADVKIGYYPISGISTCPEVSGTLKPSRSRNERWSKGTQIEWFNPQGSCSDRSRPKTDIAFYPYAQFENQLRIPGGARMFGPNVLVAADIEASEKTNKNPWTEVTLGAKSVSGEQSLALGVIVDVDTSNADYTGEYAQMLPVVQHTTLRMNRVKSIDKGVTDWTKRENYGRNFFYFGSKLGRHVKARFMAPNVLTSIRDGYTNDSYDIGRLQGGTASGQAFRQDSYRGRRQIQLLPGAHFSYCEDAACSAGRVQHQYVPSTGTKVLGGSGNAPALVNAAVKKVSLQVQCGRNFGQGAPHTHVRAWIDFNNDHRFDVNEGSSVGTCEPVTQAQNGLLAPNPTGADAALFGTTVPLQGTVTFTLKDGQEIADAKHVWLRVRSVDTNEQSVLVEGERDVPVVAFRSASAMSATRAIGSWYPTHSGETEDFLIETSRPTFAADDRFVHQLGTDTTTVAVLGNDETYRSSALGDTVTPSDARHAAVNDSRAKRIVFLPGVGTLSNNATVLTVPNEGVYRVNGNSVTFTPDPSIRQPRVLTPVNYAYEITAGSAFYRAPAASATIRGSIRRDNNASVEISSEYESQPEVGWDITKELVKNGVPVTSGDFDRTNTRTAIFAPDAHDRDTTSEIRLYDARTQNVPARYRLSVKAQKLSDRIRAVRGTVNFFASSNGPVRVDAGVQIQLINSITRASLGTCQTATNAAFTVPTAGAHALTYTCDDVTVPGSLRADQIRVSVTSTANGHRSTETRELSAGQSRVTYVGQDVRVSEKLTTHPVVFVGGAEQRQSQETSHAVVTRDNSRIYTRYWVKPDGTGKVDVGQRLNAKQLTFSAEDVLSAQKQGKVAVIDVDLSGQANAATSGVSFDPATQYGFDVRNAFTLCQGSETGTCTPPLDSQRRPVTTQSVWFKVRSGAVPKVSVTDATYASTLLPGMRLFKYAVKKDIPEANARHILASLPGEPLFEEYFAKDVTMPHTGLAPSGALPEQYRVDVEAGARAEVVTDLRGRLSAVNGSRASDITTGTPAKISANDIEFSVCHQKGDGQCQPLPNAFECRIVDGVPNGGVSAGQENWVGAPVRDVQSQPAVAPANGDYFFKCIARPLLDSAGGNREALFTSHAAYEAAKGDLSVYGNDAFEGLTLAQNSQFKVTVSFRNSNTAVAGASHDVRRFYDAAPAGKIGNSSDRPYHPPIISGVEDASTVAERSEARTTADYGNLRELRVVPGVNGQARYIRYENLPLASRKPMMWRLPSRSDISSAAETLAGISHSGDQAYYPRESLWDARKRVRVIRHIMIDPARARIVPEGSGTTVTNKALMTQMSQIPRLPATSTDFYQGDPTVRRVRELEQNAGMNFRAFYPLDPSSNGGQGSGYSDLLRQAYDAERTAVLRVTRPAVPKIAVTDAAYATTVLPGMRLDKWVFNGPEALSELETKRKPTKVDPKFQKDLSNALTFDNGSKIDERYRVDIETGIRAQLVTDLRGTLTAVEGLRDTSLNEGTARKIRADELRWDIWNDANNTNTKDSDEDLSDKFECRVLTGSALRQDQWQGASTFRPDERPENAPMGGRYYFKCLAKPFVVKQGADRAAVDAVFNNNAKYQELKNDLNVYGQDSFAAFDLGQSPNVKISVSYAGLAPEAQMNDPHALSVHSFYAPPQSGKIGSVEDSPWMPLATRQAVLLDSSRMGTADLRDESHYSVVKETVLYPVEGSGGSLNGVLEPGESCEYRVKSSTLVNVPLSDSWAVSVSKIVGRIADLAVDPAVSVSLDTVNRPDCRVRIVRELKIRDGYARSVPASGVADVTNVVRLKASRAADAGDVARVSAYDQETRVAEAAAGMDFRRSYPVDVDSAAWAGLGDFAGVRDAYRREVTARESLRSVKILVKKLRDEDPLDFAQGLRGAGFFVRPAGSVEDQARIALSERGQSGVYELTRPLIAGVEYELVENKAPEGFELLPVPVPFRVDADGRVVLLRGFDRYPKVLAVLPAQGSVVNRDVDTLVVRDPRIISVLPNSGGRGVLWSSMAGVLLIAVGMCVLRRRRRLT